MAAFTQKNAQVRTKRLWLFLASIIVVLGGFVPMLALLERGLISGDYATLVLAIVPLGANVLLMRLWNQWWLERRGELRADEHGLWLDNAIVVRRTSLRHGHVVRRDGVTCVRLGRHLRPVEVVVDGDDEGAALLAGMRLDTQHSVGRYTMSHGTRRSSWGRGGLVLALWASSNLAVMHFTENMVLFFVSLCVWALGGTIWSVHQAVRLSVGADGIRLRRLLSRPRFIPFGAVQAAEFDGQNVRIRLRDGNIETMHYRRTSNDGRSLLYRDRAEEGQMIVDRINAQAEQHRRDGTRLGVLARGARVTRDWLREVALASDEHASFRAAAVPPEELWRVVEDPVADATARAGAALALRSRLDDAGRSRLRVAADACAGPKLRIALQRLASDANPDSLEEVYEDLEDEEGDARARAGR